MGSGFWSCFSCHSSPAHRVPSGLCQALITRHHSASSVLGNPTRTGGAGYKEWKGAERKLHQSFPSSLFSPLRMCYLLAKRGKGFGTCRGKSPKFPEGNVSICRILVAAASHLHKCRREGAVGVLPTPPHLTAPSSLLPQEWGLEQVLLQGPGFS